MELVKIRFLIVDSQASDDCVHRDYGTTRGYANESEYTVVKVRIFSATKTDLTDPTHRSISTTTSRRTCPN